MPTHRDLRTARRRWPVLLVARLSRSDPEVATQRVLPNYPPRTACAPVRRPHLGSEMRLQNK